MASAVKAIRVKNKNQQHKSKSTATAEKEMADLKAHIKATEGQKKNRKNMTPAEKELDRKAMAHRRKIEQQSYPNVAGYGHISPHFGRLLPYQVEICQFYNTPLVTWSVAAVIIGNFLGIVAEKEMDPYAAEDQQLTAVWQTIDIFSNVVFTVELGLNYYGAGFRRFWNSGWNIFDFLVVAVGLLTMTDVDLGPFSMLKIFRAFRVFRLFKRIESLNKIITALLNAIPGVLNAFVIMVIFMAIYAIIAVDYFRTFGGQYPNSTQHQDDTMMYTTHIGNEVEGTYEEWDVVAITGRGFTIGDEYYGTFSRAFYTLFQVLTGESWAEAIARPLIFGVDPSSAFAVGMFFCSFILLMQIVLVNVVVAVLLDKFVADPAAGAEDGEENEDGEMAAPAPAPYDPHPAESKDTGAADRKSEMDFEKEIQGLQNSVAEFHSKIDLIMKALELDAKSFSGSTGATVAGPAPPTPGNAAAAAAQATVPAKQVD